MKSKHKSTMISTFNLLVVYFVAFSGPVNALDFDQCPIDALGMEDGRIADDQISASSSFDAISVGPQNARIRTEKASGAWCPKAQIRNGSYEFLQLSLKSTFVLRAVETQGRYGNGTGREFPLGYMLDYLRQGTNKWFRYKMRNGSEVIEGNSDTITPVLRILDPPIIAQRIRLVPYSAQTRTTCLRMEVYGCEYTGKLFRRLSLLSSSDGLVGYSVKTGPSVSAGEYEDKTFEGTASIVDGEEVVKGLGLLTDGLVPSHPPIDTAFHLPIKNSTWLGWRRNTSAGPGAVLIDFEFAAERRFTDMELFGFGQPIGEIDVDFSVDGRQFHREVEFRYPPDLIPRDRSDLYSFIVPLKGVRAQFLRIALRFTSEWAFLSEVRFRTNNNNETTSILEDITVAAQSDFYYVFAAIMVLILLGMSIALCVLLFMKKRERHGSTDKLSSIGSPSSRSTAATSLSRDIKPTTLITTLPLHGGQPRHVIHSHSFAPPSHAMLGHHKGNLYVGDCRAAASTQRILGLAPPSRSCSGTLFKDFGPHPPSLLDIHFPPPPSDSSTARVDPATSNSSSEGIYAEPCANVPLLPSPRRAGTQKRPLPKPRSRDTMTRRTKTMPMKGMDAEEEQHYAVACFSPLLPHERPASALRPYTPNYGMGHFGAPCRSIARASVQLIEKIGEGRYTQVFSCMVKVDGESRQAAIKMIHVDADEARQAILSEARLCHSVDSKHVNKLLGQTEDLSLISELCALGDVRNFLVSNPSTEAERVALCSGIADGMAYLEERGIVHGHLSPKSCLLAENLVVKVTAPRGPNHHAQLRYSAPEAIVLNNWSNRSDVFSFAITVWEILHSCRVQPLIDLSNHALVENARNQLEASANALYPQFEDADGPWDGEILGLIRECWAAFPEMRPGFHEVSMFFQRKHLNMM